MKPTLFPLYSTETKRNISENKPKTNRRKSQLNDLDLDNWKSLGEIWTDSFWLIPSCAKTGAHSNEYHGNFVSQIPRQVIQQYTKQDEVVLDGFLGSGTTAIEANRLGRKSIGIELQPKIAELYNFYLENVH